MTLMRLPAFAMFDGVIYSIICVVIVGVYVVVVVICRVAACCVVTCVGGCVADIAGCGGVVVM